MRPSIQRSTEQTRVSPDADASTVVAPSRAASASGTNRSVSALIARSQQSSERMAAAESMSRPCRWCRCTRTRCRPAALSCRNVVFSPCVHEHEPTLRQRVGAERGPRHLAEPRDLRASRCHRVTGVQAQDGPPVPHRRARARGHSSDLPLPTPVTAGGPGSHVVDPTTNCPGLDRGHGRADLFHDAGVLMPHPPWLVHRFNSVVSVFVSIVIVRSRSSVIDRRRFTLRWTHRDGYE